LRCFALSLATRSKSVSFNLLHGKDNSRIQQKIYCPVDDAIVDRAELVRGYEIEKGRYVTFTDEELKNLEARDDHAIEITEFIPLDEIDPVFFEEAYYLGCEPGSRCLLPLGTELDAQVAQDVQVLLRETRTADGAVQVALLNNRTLQALYAELAQTQH